MIPLASRGAHAAFLVVLACAVAPAAALAAPSWRLDARVAYDGTWTISGEKVIDPANPPAASTGRIEIWRAGALVPGDSASGNSDPAALATLSGFSGGLLAGDELHYFVDGTPAAVGTYTGRPSIGGDACVGASSFGAAIDAGAAALTGGAFTQQGAPDDGTATATGASSAVVALASALTGGSVSWAEEVQSLGGGSVELGSHAERLVQACGAAEGPGAPAAGASASLGNGAAGPAGTPAKTSAAGPDTTAPKLRLAASAVRARVLASFGYAFEVACGEPCVATTTLSADAATARKLKLKIGKKAKTLVLGSSTTALGAGRGVVTVRLPARVRSKLRHAGGRKLQVSVSAVDDARNRATSTAKLSVRR
jgi:hypothetical protein